MRERHRAEWLRRLVRRKPKYATGGLVSGPKPGDAPLVSIGQGGCAWPVDSIAVRISPGVVTVPHDLPVPDGVLIAMNVGGAVPGAPRSCPCIAIYSSCRCTER